MSEAKFTKGIRDIFLNDSTIFSAVGNRVFNFYIGQEQSKEYPWIVFMLDLPEPQNGLSDTSFDDVKAWKVPFTVFVCSNNQDEMIGLSYRVQELFHHFTGTISDVSIDRIIYQSYSADWAINPLCFTSTIEFEINCWDKPNFLDTTTT